MRQKLFIGFVVLVLIALSGFTGYMLKGEGCQQYERTIDGLYLGNWNETRVREHTKEIEPRGDWICTNVREMSFQEAIETCNHEVGHEIFAKVCEKDIDKCLRAVNSKE